MFKVDIKNRYTGDVQFTASIEKDTGSFSLNLGLAVKAAVVAKANLRSANLRSANLSSAYLRSANIHSDNLTLNNLSCA